jgi:hypothetical protein
LPNPVPIAGPGDPQPAVVKPTPVTLAATTGVNPQQLAGYLRHLLTVVGTILAADPTLLADLHAPTWVVRLVGAAIIAGVFKASHESNK